MIRFLFFCMLTLVGTPSLARPSGLALGRSRVVLRAGWAIQSSAKVSENGASISTTSFKPSQWYPTDVPSTVLAALVRDRVYRNPYFGMNLRRIPGSGYLASWAIAGNGAPPAANFSNFPMPPDSPFKRPWWYRSEFTAPSDWYGKNIWLHFDGINYRADIWLNGHKIADTSQVVGMWRVFCFNVTRFVHAGARNVLAVEVSPPHADDLALTWVDWNPAPPDKDMGVWRSVYLTSTGPVTVRYPQVVTHFDLPSLDVAHLEVRATLQNTLARPVEGILEGHIGKVEFHKEVHIAANSSRKIVFSSSRFPQLNFLHPRVWWPVDVGSHHLYTLQLQFGVSNTISDSRKTQFGIREITSHLDKDNIRIFEINGKRILIRGAGWAPDMMLRENPERTEAELQYVRDMHLNTLRLEGKLETKRFFDLCDRYGILVMAGWCCCAHWERWKSWKPEDYRVAADSLRDQIRRLRNHPCLLTWLNGSDIAPPPRVEDIYAGILKQEHWPNPYQTSSDSTATPGTGPTGFKGRTGGHWGPYNYEPPDFWLLDHTHGGAWGFNTETSPGPAVPPLESLEEFLPAQKLWPINEYWTFHAAGYVSRRLKVYSKALNARYGPAANVSDYAEKSQVMAYEGERAMFEAYGRNKYVSTGVIQWMLNNAWPSVVWHLFDYYLRPGGGYFGTKKACEPLHIQYSYDDRSVVIVNSFYHPWDHLTARAAVYNFNLRPKFTKTAIVSVQPDSSIRIFFIPKIQGLSTTFFVKLTLRDANNRLRSSNFYWLSTKPDVLDWRNFKGYLTPQKAYANFRDLNSLPKVHLKLSSMTENHGKDLSTQVTVENPDSTLAFFVHLKLLKGSRGSEVLPVLWQDNYFELLPGEKRMVEATYDGKTLNGKKPVVAVDGWNVVPATVPSKGAQH